MEKALYGKKVKPNDLDAGYRAMAKDKTREAEAREWAEAFIGDAFVNDLRTKTTDGKKQRAREKIEALLDKAIASGEPTEVTAQDWEDIRRELQKRHERRNGKAP